MRVSDIFHFDISGRHVHCLVLLRSYLLFHSDDSVVLNDSRLLGGFVSVNARFYTFPGEASIIMGRNETDSIVFVAVLR